MLKVRAIALLVAAALLSLILPAAAASEVVMTVAPRWATSEKLQAQGVELTASGLTPGARVYPRLENFEAPSAVVAADGTVEATIQVSEELEPGTYEAWWEDEDFQQLVTAPVQVTELALGVEGSTIIGSGFEPGQPVTLHLDGTQERKADSTGRVAFESTWSGQHEVTLRSAAGEVTQVLTLVKAPTPTPTPSVPTRPTPPRPDLLTQGEALLEAVNSGRTDEIARQMDRMREQQRELLGVDPVQARIEVLARIEAERQAQIRLNLEAQRRVAQAALDAYLAQQDSSRARQAQDLLDRQEQFQQRVERGVARPIAVLRSTPRQLGSATVTTDGVATVRLPDDVSGEHHIALIDPDSGLIVAWVPVSLDVPGTTLPRVGAAGGPELLALAVALGVSGAVVWSRASSRIRRGHSRKLLH